jgi:Uma2 family endonuclease
MRALRTRHWTREEYDGLVERGEPTSTDKVELIEGEIVPMAPQNVPHRAAQALGADVLRLAFGPGYYGSVASPLIAADNSEPEPDLAVIPGHPRDVMRPGRHPSYALLVVEIADTSLALHRGRKARLYARSGFPEYWVENPRNRTLEFYRDPVVAPDNPSQAYYATRLVLNENDYVTPLAAPSAKIAVRDLLP